MTERSSTNPVTGETLSQTDSEVVVNRAMRWLPAFRQIVVSWIVPRMTMTDTWTPSATAHPDAVQVLLPQPNDQNFMYFVQAAVEADEFMSTAKTSTDSPNLPLELGDILFFLMSTSHAVSLSSRPEIWLAELGIPSATDRWNDLGRLSGEQAILHCRLSPKHCGWQKR